VRQAPAVLPTPERVLGWLHGVADPEIPVLSIVDLGIVRELAWEHDVCVVTITPTYSGCPAMFEITRAIEQCLQEHGIDHVRIATRLAPAWTTDWMTQAGRTALRQYGIAPPVQSAIDISGITRRVAMPPVPCPQCGSASTRLISDFGSTSCKALYRCSDCREPFDYFKAH